MYGYTTDNSNENCNPAADQEMLKDIQEYIVDELQDSKYYAMLSQKAPTQRSKDLLMEFSKDEHMHAQNLMKAYYMLTGKYFYPPVIKDPVVPDDYMQALFARILAETADYKKYGEKYLVACNKWLKELFFMTRTVEGQHAMRIPLLINGY